MSKFLKFLIYSLETLDGHRGTATTFIEIKKREIKLQKLQEQSMRSLSDEYIDSLARH